MFSMLTCDFCFHSILIQADNIPVVLSSVTYKMFALFVKVICKYFLVLIYLFCLITKYM